MQLQGPVPLEDPDYAERPFELELVRQIQAGRWVLLLGPRQHGKTSALLRLRRTLNLNATQTVMVDLQAKPPFTAYAQLTTWFARKVAAALGHQVVIDETDDISAGLTQALPAGVAPIVVLIDEASNTGQRQRSWMKKQGWKIEPTMQLDSFELIINLVALGMGIGFVPIRALALYGRKRTVRRLKLPKRFSRELVVVMRKPGKASHHLMNFVGNVLF